MLRLGRQPGNSSGILDFRFDGGWFRYEAVPWLALNAYAGQPRQFSLDPAFLPDDPRQINLDTNRYLYGGSVDLGPFAEAFSANLYAINQMVYGIPDRRAVGGELRYSNNGKALYGLVDYDLWFNALNIAMLNGTWATDFGTTLTAIADHRKTPYLQTINAVLGSGATDLATVFQTVPPDQLRTQAEALTPVSDLYQVSVLHAFTKRFQLGGDVRMNKVSGTPATNCLLLPPGASTIFPNPNDPACVLPALPGSGELWTYSAQAIGADLPFTNNTLVLNGSYYSSPSYRGQSLTLSSLGRFNGKWQFDIFATYYQQKDENGVRLQRLTPSLRMDFRFLENVSLELAGGVEYTKIQSPNQRDTTMREFFFGGLRWDF